MTTTIKKMTTLGMLTAISIVLVALVHFPLIPAAPFLEYDPADVTIIIATFAMGPAAGIMLTIAVSLIQGFTVSAASGAYGVVMHIIATGSFVLVAGNIYERNKTRKTAVIALIAGTLAMTVVMAFANLLITPLFLGTPMSAVIDLLIPAIIPFNLLKAGINSVLSFVIYKSVSGYIHKNI